MAALPHAEEMTELSAFSELNKHMAMNGVSKAIGPSIDYEQTKIASVHSSSYAVDTRHRTIEVPSCDFEKSPQLKLIKLHEEEQVSEQSRGRSNRRLLWRKDNGEYEASHQARRLSPSSKKKHKQFWNQIDCDDSLTDLDSTDDDTGLPFDEARQRQIISRRPSIQKKGRSRRNVKSNSSHDSILSFLTCGCVGSSDNFEAQKLVTIDSVPTVYGV